VNAPLPHGLLPYQQRLHQMIDKWGVSFCEKSRRIGMTWGVAAKAVLFAGTTREDGGDDVLYMGYEKEMTREFIDTCAEWARWFNPACSVEEFLFRDEDGERDIQAFRIEFASGFKIVALCSRPRAFRGKQGFVILDEAAFHDDLAEVLKAALALTIWGSKVLVISTHDGAENPFNRYIAEIREGRLNYGLMRVTFDEAVAEGLYQRICKVKNKTWSTEAETAWVAEVRGQFPDGSAAEELDCIPSQSGGRYLSLVLLRARARETPVIAWKMDDAFVDLPDAERALVCLAWCEEHLGPLLKALPSDRRHYLGEDFARSGDLTDIWIYSMSLALKRECQLLVELRNVPFREQEQVLVYIGQRLPRFSGAALDARGNGQYLAERARQVFGAYRVVEVQLSQKFYAEQWPRFKAALEDDTADIPSHADVVDDFRTVEVVKGVPVIVEKTQTKDGQRHGDSAIAALLAFYASENLDEGEIVTAAVGTLRSEAYADDYRTVSEREFYAD
jgi:phage FluMu gp28-like protein